MKMFRQGDVLLVEVDSIPRGAKNITPSDRIVLAYGEVTGHAHAVYPEVVEPTVIDRALGKKPKAEIKAKLWDAGAERFLQVVQNTQLKHEEHAPINLPVGNFKVVRQREFDPERDRWVAD